MTPVLTTIFGIVIHTPVWVWALYALLLFLGLQRTRDSIVPLWRMLTLPAVVVALTISSLVGAGLGAVPAMLAGFLIGGAAGWRLERPGATRRLPDGRLWLRGEWLSFAQLVLVLVFRYATSVAAAMVPALSADWTWRFGTFFVSSVLSGLFLGRTLSRLRVSVAAASAVGS